MSEHDQAEAAELERAAEWRLRQADANPSDTASLAAARLLQNLATDLRGREASPLLHEFRAASDQWQRVAEHLFELSPSGSRENLDRVMHGSLVAANDRVMPVSGAFELFQASKQPCELYLMSDVDHFMFGEDNPRVIRLVKDWLDRYFPV